MEHIEINLFDETGLLALATALNAQKPFRHSSYQLAVNYAETMAPHAFATMPDDTLMDYRPLEEKLVSDYRKSIYEPTTYTEFKKALNVVTRIFSEGFFSIHYPNENISPTIANHLPKDFFETNFGGYGDVVKYAQQVLTPCMLGDPNAVVILDRYSKTDDDFYSIRPRVIGAERVVFYDRGDGVFVIEEMEKSVVMDGSGKAKHEGTIYSVYTPMQTIQLIQTGSKKENKFMMEIRDDHGIGVVPVMFLGGEIYAKNDIEFYKSFFDAGIPYWNKIVREESDLDASVVRHAYPQRVRMDLECNVCNGTGKETTLNSGTTRCNVCNGTGVMIGGSPFKDIIINQKIAEEITPSEVIHVVEESTTILEFMSKRIDEHKSRAMEALNMSAVEGVNNLNSGEAKRIDRQDLNLFLKKISDQIFDLIEFIYQVGILYRYSTIDGAVELIPEIQRPIGFDYVSLSDLIEESKKARESGLHPSVIKELDKAIAVKKYGKHSDVTKRIIAEIELDPYYGENPDVLLTKQSLSQGAIDPDLMYLSINMNDLMNEQMQKDKMFLMKDRITQKTTLLEIIRQRRQTAPPAQSSFNVPIQTGE